MNHEEHHHHDQPQHPGPHYKHLIIMVLLSFVAMYILMYAMVNALSNVFFNINQFYMAGLMSAPMLIIEMLVMRSMYRDKQLNIIILAVGVCLLILFYTLIRQQSWVDDKQFLKSMIPHHAGALLMCAEADIEDPEIKKLCETIKSSQQSEIDWMKAKLKKLENNH
jgi:peptidoglycan/LPS O-acetylase OafA/YrhL